MAKHAYCIIAHKDLYTLNKLIASIDDERNDIFLLIDAKSSIQQNNIYKPQYSKLIFYKKFRLFWGHISVVRAELTLLRLALNYANYTYFHLISGQDLPLHTQDEIHDSLDNTSWINYIGFAHGKNAQKALEERLMYYIPFIKYFKHQNYKVRVLTDKIRFYIVKIQKLLNLIRHDDINYYRKGCNWATMNVEFVSLLVSQEKEILKTYRGVPICDEIYKQTIIWNSEFRKTVFNYDDEYEGCKREIDWERGGPYVYTMDDLDMLKSSNRFFARKFDSAIDAQIIDELTQKRS